MYRLEKGFPFLSAKHPARHMFMLFSAVHSMALYRGKGCRFISEMNTLKPEQLNQCPSLQLEGDALNLFFLFLDQSFS